jgi:two-component system, OmpR family, sensor histidine kinase TctE
VSVTVLVDEVVGRLDPDARPRVSVQLGRGTETAVLRGDRVALREMLRNLIGNALSYSDGPIAIVLDAAAAKETIRIAVLDRGPGIPATTRRRACLNASCGAAASATGSGPGLGLPS